MPEGNRNDITQLMPLIETIPSKQRDEGLTIMAIMEDDNRTSLSLNDLAKNRQTMLSLITGSWVSQIVGTVASLSIADHLATGDLSTSDIAARTGCEADTIFRLLRASTTLGLLTYDKDTATFAGTDLLNTLRAGAPYSMRELAVALTAPGQWLSWGRFTDAVRAGRSQAVAALGAPIFEYFSEHKDEGALFSAAMANLSEPLVNEAVPVIDTTGIELVVDLGGANGTFVLNLLDNSPDARGVIVDLPHVIPTASRMITSRGLDKRCSAVAGDFFAAVPEADLYLLKSILHDWDDEACLVILRNCRAAMRLGGRLVVVELLLGEIGELGIGPLADMNMLAMSSGRERSLAEFDVLFAEAGLRRSKVIPIQQPYTMIEVVAAS